MAVATPLGCTVQTNIALSKKEFLGDLQFLSQPFPQPGKSLLLIVLPMKDASSESCAWDVTEGHCLMFVQDLLGRHADGMGSQGLRQCEARHSRMFARVIVQQSFHSLPSCFLNRSRSFKTRPVMIAASLSLKLEGSKPGAVSLSFGALQADSAIATPARPARLEDFHCTVSKRCFVSLLIILIFL